MADVDLIADLEVVLRRHGKNREVPEQIAVLYLQWCLLALEDVFLSHQERFGKQILDRNIEITRQARR